MAKQRDNSLTDADLKEWGAFLRKRNLNPSIDNQKVFSKQRPGDVRDYVVEIVDGKEVVIEVWSK